WATPPRSGERRGSVMGDLSGGGRAPAFTRGPWTARHCARASLHAHCFRTVTIPPAAKSVLRDHRLRGHQPRASHASRSGASAATVVLSPWPGLATVADGSVRDRKSTRLNSSHVKISYAVFCLKKKKDTATSI